MPKKIKYLKSDDIPSKVIKQISLTSSIVKVYDYHFDSWFYGVVKSRIYSHGKYKYVMNINNGNDKQSIFYSIVNRRWEIFDGDGSNVKIKVK